MIAGIVIGGVVVLVIIILIIFWCRRRIIEEHQTCGNWIKSWCKKTASVEPMVKLAPIMLSDKIRSEDKFKSKERWTDSSEEFRS